MEVKIALVVAAPSLTPPRDIHILLVNNQIPSLTLTSEKFCHEEANQLLYKHTDLQPGWIQLKQRGVFQDSNCGSLIVGYGCIIPEATPLKNDTRWVSITQLNELNIELGWILPDILSNL